MSESEHNVASTAKAMTDNELKELYAMLMQSALKATPVFDEAQDLVQESLTLTMEQISLGVGVRYFKAYCFQVLASLKSRMFKEQKRNQLVADVPEGASISSVDNDSMDMLVEEILLQLPETERRILELYDFDSLPLEEVAQRVGLSHSYTERLLGKAHSFIKNTLSQHYGQ